MRTQIKNQEELEFEFAMSDDDVINAVDECNQKRSEQAMLERKKKVLQQEINKIKTKIEDRMENILNRLEPRKVMCDIITCYASKNITTLFEGEIMKSERMSDYDYNRRPEDIFPTVNKSKVDLKEEAGDPNKTEMQKALERADEIETKKNNEQFPAANVNLHSEAKTETTVRGI